MFLPSEEIVVFPFGGIIEDRNLLVNECEEDKVSECYVIRQQENFRQEILIEVLQSR